MFKLFKPNENTNLKISIGEEGAVVIYTLRGKIINRLFVKTTEALDAQKLTKLLNIDNKASIRIYLNTADQLFTQKLVSGINAFSVRILARSKLKREISNNYLKTLIFVRKDITSKNWLYTFAGAPYSTLLSNWLELLLPYSNIILAIHLMPIELALILPKLTKFDLNEGKKKFNNFKFKKFLNINSSIIQAPSNYEILFFQSKSGGFREVTFLNGKVTSSNLLFNIANVDLDVMAGNIEQEISDAIDRLSKLELGLKKDLINVFLILSGDILKFVRPSKIAAHSVQTITPYQAAEKLGVADASLPKDKYFDAVFLGYVSTNDQSIKTLHIGKTKKVYILTSIIKSINISLYIISFFLILMILETLYVTIDTQLDINKLKADITTLQSKLDNKVKSISAIESNIKYKLPLEKINEIIDLDAFIKQTNENPTSIFLVLSEALPSNVKINKFKWLDSNPALQISNTEFVTKYLDIHQIYKFKISINIDATLTYKVNNYIELEKLYNEISESIESRLPYANVLISPLPKDTSNLIDRNKLNFSIMITYPVSESNANLISDFREEKDVN